MRFEKGVQEIWLTLGNSEFFLDGERIPASNINLVIGSNKKLAFSILPNDLRDFVRARFGGYIQYSSARLETNSTLQTGLKVLNTPLNVKVFCDTLVFDHMCNLDVDQKTMSESWTLSEPTPIRIIATVIDGESIGNND